MKMVIIRKIRNKNRYGLYTRNNKGNLERIEKMDYKSYEDAVTRALKLGYRPKLRGSRRRMRLI